MDATDKMLADLAAMIPKIKNAGLRVKLQLAHKQISAGGITAQVGAQMLQLIIQQSNQKAI